MVGYINSSNIMDDILHHTKYQCFTLQGPGLTHNIVARKIIIWLNRTLLIIFIDDLCSVEVFLVAPISEASNWFYVISLRLITLEASLLLLWMQGNHVFEVPNGYKMKIEPGRPGL